MHTQGHAPPRAPHHADQRGYLTLGVTLLLITLFVLLIALHPPDNTQSAAAQSADTPGSGATQTPQSPATLHAQVSYFHLRAGMHYDPTPQ